MSEEVCIDCDDQLLQTDFIIELLGQIRAQDTYGRNEKTGNCELLQQYILTKEQKKALPLVANIDAATRIRIQAFYKALTLIIEKECCHLSSLAINLNDEGFGRILIVVGRLVVLDKVVRDAHRFGFPSLAALKTESDKLLNGAQSLVSAYPQVAAI